MKVYLVDRRSGLESGHRTTIRNQLNGYFNRANPPRVRGARHTASTAAEPRIVGWRGDPEFDGEPTDLDLVCYFVERGPGPPPRVPGGLRMSGDSVAMYARNHTEFYHGIDLGPAEPGGWTVFFGDQRRMDFVVSEVYCRTAGTIQAIANVAFHELLHNKTTMDNARLHSAPGVFLGQQSVGEGNASDGDINLMRGRRRGRVRQYWPPPS